MASSFDQLIGTGEQLGTVRSSVRQVSQHRAFANAID
jgi:hypothetical protein